MVLYRHGVLPYHLARLYPSHTFEAPPMALPYLYRPRCRLANNRTERVANYVSHRIGAGVPSFECTRTPRLKAKEWLGIGAKIELIVSALFQT